jgi:tRNA(His) 5'-end guanylyltransferase
MNKDTLGDRVKRYEAVSKPLLTRRTPVVIRVDGKAFHTFTKNCDKPFDSSVMDAMVYAARETSKHMQGFQLAYVQSDEASFLLTDYDTLDTEAWYDYEINKLVSITASMFTAHFNDFWQTCKVMDDKVNLAMFDARAFNVPEDEWQNVFLWRQRDWERNSIQMLARSNFSQKELQNKGILEMHMMLLNKDVDPELRTDQQKYGTFVLKDHTNYFARVDYAGLTKLADIQKVYE